MGNDWARGIKDINLNRDGTETGYDWDVAAFCISTRAMAKGGNYVDHQ